MAILLMRVMSLVILILVIICGWIITDTYLYSI